MSTTPTAPRATGKGFGRLVVTVYGILAFAAVPRALVQIGREWPEPPLAFVLSGVAAVVYVVATVALGVGRGRWRGLAWATVGIEAVGVLVVGVLSLVSPELRHDGSVWGLFGIGYGFVPLVLPFVGLWWLRRTRPRPDDVADVATHPSDQPLESEA
ncbi:hypothetical protein [Xylanimonas protaetiae]|uniref:Integral membrane protein n=1 Tax=Xylanimonas protaetiae TaxID=2509457 RepID=A0A4P6F6F1_9MICO|nr:hypothetical protein [Xylanimonas protaetiae]QAY71332.1 hypothetical protein ET471_15910 [Xylanimonas protaetiae]